jgi:hypothetical protein
VFNTEWGKAENHDVLEENMVIYVKELKGSMDNKVK